MSATPTLHFQSPQLWLIAESDGAAHAQTFRGWAVREVCEPNARHLSGEAFRSYRVTMERHLQEGDDAGHYFIQGSYLSQAIDRMFAYITGRVLSDSGVLPYSGAVGPPPGWHSNGPEAVQTSDWNIIQSGASWFPDHRVVPRLPLEAVLRALEAYYGLDDLHGLLIDYHLSALSAAEEDVSHFLLAKALEIVRKVLEGKSLRNKEAGLPPEVKSRLRRPFQWLYDMSNNRVQTRHPISRDPAATLNPSFDNEEERDFSHDADVILRFVGSRSLGVPFVHIDRGHTIESV